MSAEWDWFGGLNLGIFPLNKTVMERSPTPLQWVHTWIGFNTIKPLTPEGWFEEGHRWLGVKNNGDAIWIPYHSKVTFLWAPDPSVKNLVLIQLREAVQKWPDALHLFIWPNLMLPIWGILIYKVVELVVYVPPGSKFLPTSMQEYFVLSLFPLSSLAGPGGSGGHPRFWNQEVRCLTCYGKVQVIQRVFWSNFGYS